MPLYFSANDHKDWTAYGLKDYGDYSDMTSEVYVESVGDSTCGEWYFIDEDTHVVPEQGTFRVVYHGSWADDHSPGESHYTHATLYDIGDPEDMVAFDDACRDWEAAPEHLDDGENDMDGCCGGCDFPMEACHCDDMDAVCEGCQMPHESCDCDEDDDCDEDEEGCDCCGMPECVVTEDDGEID